LKMMIWKHIKKVPLDSMKKIFEKIHAKIKENSKKSVTRGFKHDTDK